MSARHFSICRVFLPLAVVATGLAGCASPKTATRGAGVYPGHPSDDVSPVVRTDDTYRNLALHRAARHSSAYDYNLTAQLVTDGIRDTVTPPWISTASSAAGALPKNERERLLDDVWHTSVDVSGPKGWVQVEFGGGGGMPVVDRVEVQAQVEADDKRPEGWTWVLLVSADGKTWAEAGRAGGSRPPAKDIKSTFPLGSIRGPRVFRLEFEGAAVRQWKIGEMRFSLGNDRVRLAGPHSFASAWMSVGSQEEWVSVDLGAVCRIDRVALHWIRAASEAMFQVSDDGVRWRTVRTLFGTSGSTDELRLPVEAVGRHVRLVMTRPLQPGPFILSEMEVFGRGGPVATPRQAAGLREDGRLNLDGGWRLERASQVRTDGRALSSAGFEDVDWMAATVPGTALVSYFNAGAIPDPNFGDNQLMISDSFFHSDFWYRTEFKTPGAYKGRRAWLNFDGINWKADVFLNGEALGRIEGGFTRARFDVTDRLRRDGPNALAVRVRRNDNPGSVKEKTLKHPDKNGGILGADNPTYHASVGWDWIPTIRGRNTGIWNDVFLASTGPVTIEEPFVRTALPLPDTTRADVTVEATLKNHTAQPVSGVLRGRFGAAAFDIPVTLGPGAAQAVKAGPDTHPALRLSNPRLWWPAGYGAPDLYDVELRFETADAAVSDIKAFPCGVRQVEAREDGGALRLWVNGTRIMPRGGNWGFSESMLRYRSREYDAAVRYHRDMNFTMIRNWVGQIGDDEFYEACDRHGILVWQDFWLANPWDGPDPDDNDLFLRNARDLILRIRNHPSVALFCGRNEGFPPEPLEKGLRKLLGDLHPGLHYIPSSADEVVSGHGFYGVQPTLTYFEKRATEKFHSEMGMPNIVTLDSLRAMMPADALWPQNRFWGLHDFCLEGAQNGAAFREIVDRCYGGADRLEDWMALAQWINYEGYRAMFEAQGKNRMGLLLWMSHPCWPSFVWQTYDYYFEPTAAYFACKKACEPLHIQWNPLADAVEVVNNSGRAAPGLTARASIFNLDGSLKWEKSVRLDSAADSTVAALKPERPSGLAPVYFLRLELRSGDDRVSGNLYWCSLQKDDYRALRAAPRVTLDAATAAQLANGRWTLTTELSNPSERPAMMVRLKAVRSNSGDRILPALYEDNYIFLMPGEKRTLRTELDEADARGEIPRMVVEGFNVDGVSYR